MVAPPATAVSVITAGDAGLAHLVPAVQNPDDEVKHG
jgi:hypothetical protein